MKTFSYLKLLKTETMKIFNKKEVLEQIIKSINDGAINSVKYCLDI